MYTAPIDAQSFVLKASRRPTLHSGVNHPDRIRAVTASLGFQNAPIRFKISSALL